MPNAKPMLPVSFFTDPSVTTVTEAVPAVLGGLIAPYERKDIVPTALSNRLLVSRNRGFVHDGRELSDHTWLNTDGTGRFFAESGFALIEAHGVECAVNQRVRRGLVNVRDNQVTASEGLEIKQMMLVVERFADNDEWHMSLLSACSPRPSLGGSFVVTGEFHAAEWPSLLSLDQDFFEGQLGVRASDQFAHEPVVVLFLKPNL